MLKVIRRQSEPEPVADATASLVNCLSRAQLCRVLEMEGHAGEFRSVAGGCEPAVRRSPVALRVGRVGCFVDNNLHPCERTHVVEDQRGGEELTEAEPAPRDRVAGCRVSRHGCPVCLDCLAHGQRKGPLLEITGNQPVAEGGHGRSHSRKEKGEGHAGRTTRVGLQSSLGKVAEPCSVLCTFGCTLQETACCEIPPTRGTTPARPRSTGVVLSS